MKFSMILFVTVVVTFAAVYASVPNTDCRPGWIYYRGSCYAFGDVPKKWSDAASICKSHGGYLVEIESFQENNWLVARLRSLNYGSVWIGASEILHRGTLLWANSGNPITFSDWSAGQPSDPPGILEDCVEIRAPFGYKWNDYECDYGNKYICEASPLPSNR